MNPPLLRRCPHVRCRRVGDEVVVLHQGRGEVLALDWVGGRIVELVDGATSLQTIVDLLLDELEVEREVLAADVARFVADLVAAGIVEGVEAPAP